MPRELKRGEYLGHATAVARWESCSVSETRYARGAYLPTHRHDGGFLTFVLSGGYRERAAGQTRSCAARNLVVHPPGETHEDDFADGSARCLNVSLEPAFVARLGEGASSLQHSAVVGGAAVTAIGSRISAELMAHDPVSGLIVEGLLLELAGMLGRSAASDRRLTDDWFRGASAMVERRFLEKIKLSSVAHEAGVHPVHLARRFRQHFGVSVGQRVRALRVEHARELIARGTPLPAVATECGFADQSHFTRTFTRVAGVSPGAYRRTASRASRVPKRFNR
jgi:AraC family transcriptional regulator